MSNYRRVITHNGTVYQQSEFDSYAESITNFPDIRNEPRKSATDVYKLEIIRLSDMKVVDKGWGHFINGWVYAGIEDFHA